MPKISVIIPIYNAQDYLKRCLDSIVNQTLNDIEIICVNDCSNDKSLDIIEEYSKKDKRIKLINHNTNCGESKSRNDGIKYASGDYIAFVDNDDEIDLDFYEKLYKRAIETNSDITKAQHYEISYSGKKDIPPSHNNQDEIEKNKLCFLGMWWTAIYKKSLIKDNNLTLPEDFLISGDRIFLQKAVLKANFVSTVKNTFYYHYARENSGFSKKLSEKKLLDGTRAVKLILEEINNLNIDITNPEGYDCIYKEQFGVLMVLHFYNADYSRASIYAEEMIELYKRCRRKEILDLYIKDNYLALYNILVQEDLNGLINLFSKIKTSKDLVFANIRSKIKGAK